MSDFIEKLTALLNHPELPASARPALEALGRRPLDRAPLGARSTLALPAPDDNNAASAASPSSSMLAAMERSSPDRYQELSQIGAGGMGEVLRVLDGTLNRPVAMKVIRRELADLPSVLARFMQEAQTTAQLEHPSIVPVYEIGRLGDGRLYFTMKEVRGRTLGSVIREVHTDDEAAGGSGWTFRRVVDAFLRVCDAVGYAHARGVVHRDLKPENVMVGEFGEVLVVDWGLARVIGGRDFAAEAGELDPVVTTALAPGATVTRSGAVEGTPAYMSPEQARGEIDAIDARSDVYALGAILYEILSGRPPYLGRDAGSVLRQVLHGPPPPPGQAITLRDDQLSFQFGTTRVEGQPDDDACLDPTPPPPLDDAAALAWADAGQIPAELIEACRRAMARDPAERYQDARALAAAIASWLDGARRREQAQEVLTRALARYPEAHDLRQQAEHLREIAARQLDLLPAWAAERDKAPAWAQEDTADALEQTAALRELEAESLLHAALSHAPDLDLAHAALAERYRAEHAAEELRHQGAAARRAEVRLREHAWALPERHPDRQRHLDYLQGDGALTLITDPPDARVLLHRYQHRNRRLVPTFERALGSTPLDAVRLPMGSYLLEIEHDERATVAYPVQIRRQEHWRGERPGSTWTHPIYLPRHDELTPHDVYIPAGWCECGDPRAPEALPQRRLWVDGFVLRRFPVTNAEYIEFLNDLVVQGREDEVLRCVPRERAGTIERPGAMTYARDPDGSFRLSADSDGDVWQPDWPVMLVDLYAALSYCRWLAHRTGLPWRLPGELEWEKAARGVDGRLYPWGNRIDPSWCCIRDSHPGRQLPTAVDSFPVDTSPWGVRGLAGNVRDWCLDAFLKEGPPCPDDIAPRPDPELLNHLPADALITTRGGGWFNQDPHARAFHRGSYPPQYRLHNLGFRLARSFPE